MYKFRNNNLIAIILTCIMVFSGLITPIGMGNKIVWAENSKIEPTVTEAVYSDKNEQDGIWEAVESNTNENLVDIWKSSDGEVFILGQRSIYKYVSGEGLKVLYHTDEPTVYLDSIWGTSSENIYVVGGIYEDDSAYVQGYSEQSIFLKYDGNKCKRIDLDLNSNIYYYPWYDIEGVDKDNIFIVGMGFIIRYDGNKWTNFKLSDYELFSGIQVKNENDIYILGQNEDYMAMFMHFNGEEWKQYDSECEDITFSDIFVKDFNEIYLAGRDDCDRNGFGKNVKFDGKNFTEATELSEFKRINDFWTKNSNNTYAVGYDEDEKGLIYHYDGSKWRKVAVPEVLLDEKLNCIVGIDKENLLVVGDHGTILEYKVTDKKDLKLSKLDVTIDVSKKTLDIDALVSYIGKRDAENVTIAVYGVVYGEDDYDFIKEETTTFEPNCTNTIKFKDIPIEKLNNKNIKVVVDALNIVKEEDEENNILEKEIKTDLSIVDIKFLENRETIYKANKENKGFRIKYANNGNIKIKNIDILVYENNQVIHKFPFKELPNEGTVELDKWTPKSGTIKLKAVIDENDVIPETDEENNEKSIDLKIVANIKDMNWIKINIPEWDPVDCGTGMPYNAPNGVGDILAFENGEIYVKARRGLYKYEKKQGGTSWQLIKNRDEVDCIWGDSPKNIFTAKYLQKSDDKNECFVEHFNGENWKRINIDHPDVINNSLGIRQVWGSSREDIYINNGKGIYHYDGASWKAYDLGFKLYRDPLIASHDNIYALSIDQKIYHYDGDRWSGYKVNYKGLSDREIEDIYLDANNHLCIVYKQNINGINSDIEQLGVACFNGESWKSISFPFLTRRINLSSNIHRRTRLCILDENNIYLMKDSLYYYDGQNWNEIAGTNNDDLIKPDGIDSGLDTIIGFGSDKLFLAGDRGRVWYRGTGLDIKEDSDYNNNEQDVNSVKVYIRVEGYDKTFVPRTSIVVDNFDLTPYLGKATGESATESKGWGPDRLKNPTVAHALIKALEQQGFDCTDHNSGCDLQDYGWSLYIAMIGGDREFDHRHTSGWMYRVNGWLPNYGCQAYRLKGGEDILWYFGAYGFDTWVTEIESDKSSVNTGEKVEVKLKGVVTPYNEEGDSFGSDREKLIKNATIYVNGKPYEMDGKEVKTNEEGKATLIFYEPGTYEISAERINGEGLRDIVRPLPIKIQVRGESKTPSGGINLDIKDVDKTLDELDKNMDKINTSEEEKEVVKKVTEIKNKLKKAAEKVKNEKEAHNVFNKATKTINILVKLSDKIMDKDNKKDVSIIAVENMKIILKLMDKITDKKEINKATSDIIDAAGNLIEKLGGENKKEFIDNAVKATKKAIEKSFRQEISKDALEERKDTVLVKIDMDEINAMTDEIESIEREMKEKLKQNKINQKIDLEKILKIEIPSKDKKEVYISLASNVINNLKQDGIEKLEIRTENAVFKLTPNTFNDKENKEEIALIAKIVDRNILTPLERYKIPKDCVLIDLDAKVGNEKINKFNEPIEVSIPYKGKVNKGETVQVFLLKKDGTIENMGGEYDSDTKMVTFTTPHFSKYFANKVKVIFKDLGGYEWAKEAIEAMAQKGIINGREEGIFDPSANITRAEFATLMTKMMGYNTENIEIPFTDVDKDTWYYDYVGAAYKNGLIRGRSSTVFDPNGKITREEMAVIVAKVLKQKGYKEATLEELNIFRDKEEISVWAREAVSMCVKEKIIRGMEDGRFAPKERANRAQAAVMLYKLYNLIH
ncbi:S-layer homology domain-containing protein [Caminicella sporogenes]|uniref:S-layer homology domain-containing protein n=1 Tax=Caminicella sporogenes TaxID=166485 RepID=UPI002541AE33|nr:S-layer homology domain-containing protein [Caminicella sporogenes]WIF95920.1 S-layer homology domain-containing protein [Caminicella sporogenes]